MVLFAPFAAASSVHNSGQSLMRIEPFVKVLAPAEVPLGNLFWWQVPQQGALPSVSESEPADCELFKTDLTRYQVENMSREMICIFISLVPV